MQPLAPRKYVPDPTLADLVGPYDGVEEGGQEMAGALNVSGFSEGCQWTAPSDHPGPLSPSTELDCVQPVSCILRMPTSPAFHHRVMHPYIAWAKDSYRSDDERLVEIREDKE